MGTASSVVPSERKSSQRKSVREQFNKEFGKSFYTEDGGQPSGKGDISKSTKAESDDVGSTAKEVQDKDGDPPPGGRRKMSVNAAVFHAKTMFMRPIMKNRPKKDNLITRKQDNVALIKEVFQRMALNTESSRRPIAGELEIGLNFKPEYSTLLVKIGRGKGFNRDEGAGCPPNSYVAIDLSTPGNPVSVPTRKTKVKTGSSDPYYCEILEFPLNQRQVLCSKLRVSVFDRVNKKTDDVIGENVLDLSKLDMSYDGSVWYKIHPKPDLSFRGNLEVSLLFKEPHSLLVTINRATGLKACNDDNETSNPYARIYVTGLPDKYQTETKINTVYPDWMETFEFDVYSNEFTRRVVIISLMSKNNTRGRGGSGGGKHDYHLGDVHIPLVNFNRNHDNGIPKEHVVKDLRNSSYVESDFSVEGLTFEFRESMMAHLLYGHPKFLFKKHEKGKKMISCKCAKAHTQTKMILQNGHLTTYQAEI